MGPKAGPAIGPPTPGHVSPPPRTCAPGVGPNLATSRRRRRHMSSDKEKPGPLGQPREPGGLATGSPEGKAGRTPKHAQTTRHVVDGGEAWAPRQSTKGEGPFTPGHVATPARARLAADGAPGRARAWERHAAGPPGHDGRGWTVPHLRGDRTQAPRDAARRTPTLSQPRDLHGTGARDTGSRRAPHSPENQQQRAQRTN
ncbi:collagen alpha-1(VII) chain-like [Procambarus clarkii]|uniref:collagen alpha-1(VII) chain-like n=1 Tax=Procambarus clarkii TaxID=6728 RepID=UPI00374375A0